MITQNRLKAGMRVRYVTDCPNHSENGTVSSWNEAYVFVKFDERVLRHGMGGTTAEGCDHRDLLEIDREYNDRLQATSIKGTL
jgi:hypothetical protein